MGAALKPERGSADPEAMSTPPLLLPSPRLPTVRRALETDDAVRLIDQTLAGAGWPSLLDGPVLDVYARTAEQAFTVQNDDLPIERGIYVLLTVMHKFEHPRGGRTRVLKIGSGSGRDGLRGRLSRQVKWARDATSAQTADALYSHFHWGANHGLVLAWSLAPSCVDGLRTKAMEATLHAAFYDRFWGYPIGSHQGR